MKVNLTLEAESEEESKLMERVAKIRNEALDDGMSTEEVARVFMVFAQGMLSPSFEEQGVSHVKDEKPLCPSCGSILERVEFEGIGQDPTVVPCGCTVLYDDLPQEVLDDM